MRENRVKKIMKSGGLAIGAGARFADAAVVEIIGLAGFDAVFIDMEHTAFDLRIVEEMIRAADQVGITSIVRVPDNSPGFILRILDMGVQGIRVPHIANHEAAAAAVRAVRYPPLGDRGIGQSSRAARYSAISLEDHVTSSNEEILLVVMIEDLEAVNDIDAIANTDGIDLIAVGPADLARALGVVGTKNHPKLRSTVEKIARSIKKAGKASMECSLMHSILPLDIPELIELGVGYATCQPVDQVRLLRSYQEQVKVIRSKLQNNSTLRGTTST